ncbi:MAG: hypothetical protein PVJ46_03795 [Methyloceanibacter sp.]
MSKRSLTNSRLVRLYSRPAGTLFVLALCCLTTSGLEIGEKGGSFTYRVEDDYSAPFDSGTGIQTWAVTGGEAYRI